MTILLLKEDKIFSKCENAFLVTGKPNNRDLDRQNTEFLKQNKTGFWRIADKRIQPGDAIFLLLPNQEKNNGYPRKLYGGKVSEIELNGDRKVIKTDKFHYITSIEKNIKEYLNGNNPPQGNQALKIWPKTQTLNEINIGAYEEVNKSLKDTQAARLKRLKNAEKRPKKIQVTIDSYRRNPDVVAEALFRANGVCQACKNKAPFLRASDKTPFLEVHHKKPLSDGGLDTIENAIALCPNCHRQAHYG